MKSSTPSPAITESMSIILQTMAEAKKSAVTIRIDDAVEEGMGEHQSQDIMTQCAMMQKALLNKDRVDRNSI